MPTLIDSTGNTITFDNILEENYSESAIVTDHPITNSANVTDHRQVNPRILTIRALVTETPYEGYQNEFVAEEYLFMDGWRSFRYLAAIRANAPEPFTYISQRLGTHENYMLERMEYTVENARHLIINLELKEVSFAAAQRVDLPKVKVRRKRPSVCPVVNQGDRQKENVKGGIPPIIFTEDELYPPRDLSATRNTVFGLATDAEGVDIVNDFFSIRR